MSKSRKHGEERTVVLLDDSLRASEGFTQIPNSVLRHPTLTMGAKGVYSVLLSYAWQDDFCHPAQESLARDCGIGERQVRRLLNELKMVGAISWKQLGLNKPNRYFINPITDWIKPKHVSKSPTEKDRANLTGPDRTYMSGQERAPVTGQDGTQMSAYKDSKKNTHRTTHTGRRMSVSVKKKTAQALIDRFHAEHGRSPEGRKANRNEIDFALKLLKNHSYEKANHVITFGLQAAGQTNYQTRLFQGYEQYVPEAIRDYERHQKSLAAEKAAEVRRAEERREHLEAMRKHYARPLDERLDKQVEIFRKRTRLLQSREPTREEELAHGEKWREIELRNENEFA